MSKLTKKCIVIASFMCIMLAIIVGCKDSKDDRIARYRGPDDTVIGLHSMSDVIEALGKPDEVWGSSVGSEIVFIYEGQKDYSVLFVAGSFPMKVIQGRLGGKDAVPISEPFDFEVRGNSIDLKQRGMRWE